MQMSEFKFQSLIKIIDQLTVSYINDRAHRHRDFFCDAAALEEEYQSGSIVEQVLKSANKIHS